MKLQVATESGLTKSSKAVMIKLWLIEVMAVRHQLELADWELRVKQIEVWAVMVAKEFPQLGSMKINSVMLRAIEVLNWSIIMVEEGTNWFAIVVMEETSLFAVVVMEETSWFAVLVGEETSQFAVVVMEGTSLFAVVAGEGTNQFAFEVMEEISWFAVVVEVETNLFALKVEEVMNQFTIGIKEPMNSIVLLVFIAAMKTQELKARTVNLNSMVFMVTMVTAMQVPLKYYQFESWVLSQMYLVKLLRIDQ